MKKFSFLFIVTLVFSLNHMMAQVVSTSGLNITVSTGTVINMDTVNSNSGTILANEGLLTVGTINNAGTLQGNGTYNISTIFVNTGTFTPNGSTVNYNGSANQNITGLLYYNLSISTSAIKSVAGTINILNELSLGANTTLALGNNNIRLKSDSTYTARITTVPNTATVTYGTGRFIADRYVKGRRKYRLFTSPVTSSPNATLIAGEEAQSIWGNWQNAGNNVIANNGTLITGGNAGDGFDTQTSNASLFTYNPSTRSFTGLTTANAKNTKYTPLKAGSPYYMFIWGDRTNSAISTSPNKTVISSTGKILTGDQTYNTASTFQLTNTVGGFSLIGNPFASPIDWSTITRTNLSDTYWGWDPNLNSTGGYVTVTSTGTVTLISPFSGSVGLNQYIQSGQAFFVKTTATSPVMTIKETDKTGNYNALAFRTEANDIPLMAINLFYDEVNPGLLMDGTLAAFDPNFSDAITDEDAVKLNRAGEEVSILKNKIQLSIDAQKTPLYGDTIFLNITGYTKTAYRMQVFTKYLGQYTVKAWLEDDFLKTAKEISFTDTSNIVFDINKTVTASIDPRRFRIVFGKTSFAEVSTPPVEIKTEIKIAGNPVRDKKLRFEHHNLVSGSYSIRIFNALGQLVNLQTLFIEGGTGIQTINLPVSLASGNYYLNINNNSGIRLNQAFILQ